MGFPMEIGHDSTALKRGDSGNSDKYLFIQSVKNTKRLISITFCVENLTQHFP